LIEPEGVVALFADRHPEVPDNHWRRECDDLVSRYTDGDSVRSMRKSPTWVRHEAFLLASPFRQLERISVIERRRVSVETLVDRIRSMSITSRDRLGDRAEALADEIRVAMNRYADGGLVTEVVESEALMARR